ncbi:hypothetical protein BHE74_00003603, partial [Ensete ventricosum]
VGHLGEAYQEWVHQPIASKEGPRLFANDLLEFWNLVKLIATPSTTPALFGGGLLGYVVYDCTHYYLHHGQPSKDPAKNLKVSLFLSIPALPSEPSLQNSKQGVWNNFFTLGLCLWDIAPNKILFLKQLILTHCGKGICKFEVRFYYLISD